MAVPKASAAAAAVGYRARASGSSPRERFAVSGPSRSGRLVSPATTPASLLASHVPPPTSSRPPRMVRLVPAPSRRVMGTVGRARRSSRLAATIKGSPGTTPLITINRHIGRSVRAWDVAPPRCHEGLRRAGGAAKWRGGAGMARATVVLEGCTPRFQIQLLAYHPVARADLAPFGTGAGPTGLQ